MFTQKISMDCTQEQYEKYLKAELEKMGYGASLARWGDDVIVNNYSSENGLVGNPSRISNKFDNSRTYLGKFNAPLFLALAAMTDEKYGGYGEWWYVIDDSSPRSFTRGKIYKGLSSIRSSNSLIDNFGDTNGYSLQENPLQCVRKATVSEIMAKFGEQPHKDTDRLIEELQQQAKAMLEALIELKKEQEEPKHKEPIVGEMAIMWRNDTSKALCRIYRNSEGRRHYDTAGVEADNAILFESVEQYKAFINA